LTPAASPANTLPPADLAQAGLLHMAEGDYRQALACFQSAAAAFGQAGDLPNQAEMLNNAGVAHLRLGHWADSQARLEQAAAHFVSLGDTVRHGQAVANLADLFAARRQRQQAVAYYGEAATLLLEAGDRVRASQVWRALSLLHLRQGHWLAAMAAMERSLSAAPRLSLPRRFFRLLLRLSLGGAGGA
jgi:tetratricopeptide (TPR) repeat protein